MAYDKGKPLKKQNIQTRKRSFVLQVGTLFHEVACWEYRREHAQKSALFIPDFLGNAKDFESLAFSMARAGYHCVALDMPGRGESAAFAGVEATLMNYVACVVGAIEECGLKDVTLVGKGWGGVIAALASLSKPHKIKTMVLLDTLFDWSGISRETLQALYKLSLRDFEDIQELSLALRPVTDTFGDLADPNYLLRNRTRTGQGGRLRFAFNPTIFEPVLNSDHEPRPFPDLAARLRHHYFVLLSDGITGRQAEALRESVGSSGLGRVVPCTLGLNGWFLKPGQECLLVLGAITALETP